MKRIIGIILLYVCGIGWVVAQEGGKLAEADGLYAQGEYRQAAALYEEVLATEGIAPEVYYNLGNAWYKAGEVARSVLAYERALRLDPGYEDARFNLELVRNRVIDNIPEADVFFVKRWVQELMAWRTSDQWLYISWTLFVVALAGALLFVFGRRRAVRKASFAVGITVLVLSGLSLIFSITGKNHFLRHDHAVVMSEVVTVKSSPDRSGTDLFELHEGTKVQVKSTLGQWDEIVIGDGRIGWAESRHLEKI